MIICPHCGKPLFSESTQRELTAETLNEILSITGKKYSDETKKLIAKLANLSESPVLSTKRFILRVHQKTDDEINYGLTLFFKREYHLKGYQWQWAAGIIQRENFYKKKQSQLRLPPIPKE